MFKFKPRYIGSIRTCDNPNCDPGDVSQPIKLHKYPNDLNMKLLFCEKHIKNPYDELLSEVPDFKWENYQLVSNDNLLCYYVGCKSHQKLVNLHQGYWCTSHARDITQLKVSILTKSNKHGYLINRIKEFLCRKLLNQSLIDEIIMLEKELNVSYLNCNINSLHYKYILDNHNKLEGVNENNYQYSYFSKTNKEYFNDLFRIK